ncbi:hypothetical protein ACFQI7_30255 [Paenibacillus allorhizosphaerae]|uniref:Lipocalin-like domain-containing protein n=1 Tax=Paenibacillus allorhizosphaerae TaxID=2849866 RepID=A0ABN7TJS8_9BACL|nr:hypothetical protein [Paenibacillus allorhizosphaerae]CAG7640285.1 hypothetical protein PAECIP111802_02632 [Paenibacillus allorhizosphaerae]
MKNSFYSSTLLLIVLVICSFGKINYNMPATPSTAPTPSYYGDWTVQKWIGSTPVSTAVDERIIGMKATYMKEKASFDKETILNSEYEEIEITNDDFLKEYRTQLSDIGINSKSVTTVKINDWTNPGSFLIIKDEQTMIILWDGNYFEMKRKI